MNMNPTNNEPLGRVMFESPHGMIYPATKDAYVSQGTKPVLVLPWDAKGIIELRCDIATMIVAIENGTDPRNATDDFLRALAPDEKGNK